MLNIYSIYTIIKQYLNRDTTLKAISVVSVEPQARGAVNRGVTVDCVVSVVGVV